MMKGKEKIFEEPVLVSKSQLRRDALEIKSLALELINLGQSKLGQVPLDLHGEVPVHILGLFKSGNKISGSAAILIYYSLEFFQLFRRHNFNRRFGFLL